VSIERRSSGGTLSSAFLQAGSSSFAEFLAMHDPSLLPAGRPLPPGTSVDAVHGTTIVSLTFAGGVVMAGDRRATMGNVIAQKDIEKVFPADESSCVGIAGTAGLAVEMVKLIRGNLGMAMQGLAVVPMFAGYDPETHGGRIFSYDVTGGRYEEHRHHSVGSGSMFARGALKKLWREDISPAEAISVAVESLYDAADDDSATGGPDLARGILPVIAVVDSDGYRRVPESELDPIVRAVVAARQSRPDGPVAPITG